MTTLLKSINSLKGTKFYINGKPLVITKPINFVVSVTIMITLVLSAFIYMIKVVGHEEWPRIYDKNIVGCYVYIHKLYDGTKVYELTTPRGVELVRSEENLQLSLDTYREQGVYGKDYRTLK